MGVGEDCNTVKIFSLSRLARVPSTGKIPLLQDFVLGFETALALQFSVGMLLDLSS